MTTDKHRAFAREHAAKIYQHHLEKSGGVGADANHISKEISYEESLYRGLLAECDFAVKFGIRVNRDVHEGGDDGKDFMLPLLVNGAARDFRVDVKSKSVLYGDDGWAKLIISGTHLRVPVKEVKPQTIYVLATYYVGDDIAQVRCWTWGKALIERNERASFKNGTGIENYLMPFEELRELQELKDRMP